MHENRPLLAYLLRYGITPSLAVQTLDPSVARRYPLPAGGYWTACGRLPSPHAARRPAWLLARGYCDPLQHTGIKFAPSLSCVGGAWQGRSPGLRLPTYASWRGASDGCRPKLYRWPLRGRAPLPLPQTISRVSLWMFSSIMRDLPLIMSLLGRWPLSPSRFGLSGRASQEQTPENVR